MPSRSTRDSEVRYAYKHNTFPPISLDVTGTHIYIDRGRGRGGYVYNSRVQKGIDIY